VQALSARSANVGLAAVLPEADFDRCVHRENHVLPPRDEVRVNAERNASLWTRVAPAAH